MGSHYAGSPREVRALDAYIKLSRALATIDGCLTVSLADQGMTVRQLAVLEALLHLGPLSQTELGSKVLRTGGSVTSMVDHLEGKKLVRRERSKQDRRVIHVHLTAAGKRAITRVLPGHVANVVEAFGGLSSREQEELGRLCRKLGLGAAGDPY